MAKIMVFDEKISSYDEKVFPIPEREGICFLCFNITKLKYGVFNHMVHPYPICSHCGMVYYGGYVLHTGEIIPIDPLLKYLDEIDPIEA